MQPGERHSDQDLADLARGIIDANRYMTLATADGDGGPWAAPVSYAHQADTEFLWISLPAARPAPRPGPNVPVRPHPGTVIFHSPVPAGQGQAVYVEAQASELGGPEPER